MVFVTADGGTLEGATRATEIERSITIRASEDELYRLWRDPQHLSRIMDHFATVTAVDGGRHYWVIPLPIGQIAWNTRTVAEHPSESLRWEPLAGPRIFDDVSVHFRPAPGDRGTEVTLRIRFALPSGIVGCVVMGRIDTGLGLLVNTVLRRSKSLVETGEIPTLAHNPSARGSGDTI